MRALLAACVIAISAQSLADDVYRWTDSSGQVHYTDDVSTIPADQRAKAEKTEGGEVILETSGGGSTVSSAPADETPSEDEASWRARFKEARDQVAQAEKRLADDQGTLDDPAAHGVPVSKFINGVYLPNPELEKVRQRVEKDKQDVEAARRALDDLDRKASEAAVPRAWRR